jgi:hypothetical protein
MMDLVRSSRHKRPEQKGVTTTHLRSYLVPFSFQHSDSGHGVEKSRASVRLGERDQHGGEGGTSMRRHTYIYER